MLPACRFISSLLWALWLVLAGQPKPTQKSTSTYDCSELRVELVAYADNLVFFLLALASFNFICSFSISNILSQSRIRFALVVRIMTTDVAN